MSQHIKPQKRTECHPDELIFIQSRAEINLPIVEEYADMMANGTVFDPIEGIQDENGIIYIHDGYHRGEAAKRVGTTLQVNLQPGSRTEAEWLALTANQKHGLRRTNKDKQRVVRQALLHPFGVNLSNSELARHCGVNDKTVAKIRREMETSSEIPKIDKRIVQRNGVTYKQNTRNIGHIQCEMQGDGSERKLVLSEQLARSLNTCTHLPFRPDWSQSLNETNQVPEGPTNGSDAPEHPKYQLNPQAFECPRCGQEKIVGVNGSRRWCLNCMAEWPTADAFLTEVNAGRGQGFEKHSRQQLQSRFQNILARLDEPELVKVKTWLDTLEAELDLAEDTDHTNEEIALTNVILVPEYA